ncbi:hypothetical protein VOLCADRAFT_82382 [Volvox carteri f. nagariensis]|uniref:Nudix hydrolase domain-containing protein n=1 Tax=Volvox carteri f. nagariensis TaxID=3068 RepID=D8U4N7_VOLCA|nr:uncharacterized protein VOLCADRAFT_82382 [Volvox carteri f. nagariensis]EFJ45308.1 hypothetical protein VOLCADRAFT_82382 [Volvox carteri f. nagariensis]|eukprot:XP_002953684.1 hypothetical protein VOLCADRAFT_82382 [Volvox carteri f. nagariensis]
MTLSWLAIDGGAAVAAGGQRGASGGPDSGLEEGEASRTLGEDVVFEDAVHTFRDIHWGEHQYRIHSFLYGEYDVWGLTATICIDAARLALGQEPLFQERCPGGHHYSAFFWDGTSLRLRPCASTAPSSMREQQEQQERGDVARCRS